MAARLSPDSAGAPETRLLALQEAESWIGTPYRHQGSIKGVGCDCLGLIRGVWRSLYGDVISVPATYTQDWNVTGTRDPLLEAANEHLLALDGAEWLPGDLLVFRWIAFAPSRHLAIAAPGNTMIHAYQRHAVLRSAIVPSWRRRISGAFRFPDPN